MTAATRANVPGTATTGGPDDQGADGSLAPIPGRWSPVPATAAVIVVDGKDYLLQLRDDRAGIWYPGHWGLFGGQNLPGESPEACIRRELSEELGLVASELRHFMNMSFEFSFADGSLSRSIYELQVSGSELGRLRLGEGRAMRAFEPQAINVARLVPCDRFVLDLHIHRRRLTDAG